MSLLARFIAANQRRCKATENHLPAVFKRHIQTLYKYQVAELINHRHAQVVLDVGGGKECPFLPFLDPLCGHLIIALDLSDEELRHNRQLDHKIVADAAAHGFPFRDGSADLVVSRAVIEHIRDNDAEPRRKAPRLTVIELAKDPYCPNKHFKIVRRGRIGKGWVRSAGLTLPGCLAGRVPVEEAISQSGGRGDGPD